MNSKTRKIIGWILSGLIAFIFIASGIMKLMGGTPEMVVGLGGETHLLILGSLELIIVGLFLVPKTAFIGTLLAIAYIGGAMGVHFIGSQPLFVPIFIQVLIWVSAVVRFPEVSQRILGK